MRYLFLASTALLALSPLSARADMAVTVDGFTAFQAGFFDNDSANNAGRDFLHESEIGVTAEGRTDAGLTYGAYVQLETSTSDTGNAGKEWIYLEGGFGRLELGDAYGPGTQMAVFAPTVGVGQINGSYDDFIPAADRGHEVNNRGDARFTPVHSEQATKVSYMTPVFSGFQAGASFAPEYDNSHLGEDVQFDKTSSTNRNVIELGLTYEGGFSGVGIKLGGNYNHGDSTNSTVHGIDSWGVGTQLSYNGFTLGGGYGHDGTSLSNKAWTDDEVSTWNVGATYENDSWGVGVSYLDRDFNTEGDASTMLASDANAGRYSVVAVGGVYTVTPGLTLGADAAWYNRNRATGTDTDGFVLVTDVTAAF